MKPKALISLLIIAALIGFVIGYSISRPRAVYSEPTQPALLHALQKQIKP